jgi:hypothetical protein
MKIILNNLPYREGRNKSSPNVITQHVKKHYGNLSLVSQPNDFLYNGPLYHYSHAYSSHDNIIIAPHDLWYIVLCEIASIIKNNVEAARFLFTTSEEKTTITIPTDDVTELPIEILFMELKKVVPANINLFIPNFSTHTTDSRIACMASFCDAMQVYYEYMTFCCGIHAVEIRGTVEDWELFKTSVGQISGLLGHIPKTTDYFQRVNSHINNIIASLTVMSEEEKINFYANFFKQNNIGSGGEVIIDGWITDFYFEKCSLPKIENFSLNLSCIPYKNLNTGREFVAVYGSFSQTVEDSFKGIKYDNFIYERT